MGLAGESFQQIGIGIDAAIAQKGPDAAMVLHSLGIDVAQKQGLVVVVQPLEHAAAGIANEGVATAATYTPLAMACARMEVTQASSHLALSALASAAGSPATSRSSYPMAVG
jgi:hypothetical protein